VRAQQQENRPLRANESRGNDGDGAGKKLASEFPAGMTVEEYLNRERDLLAAEILAYGNGLAEKLKVEYGHLKASYLKRVEAAGIRDLGLIGEAAPAGPVVPTHLSVQLEVEEGQYKGESFVTEPRLKQSSLIGRSKSKKLMGPGKGVSLARDYEVSSAHAKFEVTADGRLAIVDLGSTNGTTVNGGKIDADARHVLAVNDVLNIGTNTIRVAAITPLPDA